MGGGRDCSVQEDEQRAGRRGAGGCGRGDGRFCCVQPALRAEGAGAGEPAVRGEGARALSLFELALKHFFATSPTLLFASRTMIGLVAPNIKGLGRISSHGLPSFPFDSFLSVAWGPGIFCFCLSRRFNSFDRS